MTKLGNRTRQKKFKHKTASAESQETDLDLTWDIY